MDASPPAPTAFDRVLTNCRVINPANGADDCLDVGISGGRIAAVARGLTQFPHRNRIDLDSAIVAPGFIDVHVHVYEWVTNFGVPADAAGVHAGAAGRDLPDLTAPSERCARAHRAQPRKRPISPGSPPGKSSTRAVRWNPRGFRSRSHRR